LVLEKANTATKTNKKKKNSIQKEKSGMQEKKALPKKPQTTNLLKKEKKIIKINNARKEY